MMEYRSSIDLNIVRYKPIRKSSYTPTPLGLVGKEAIVNIQNEDMLCFLYCILAFLYPVAKDAYRPCKYTKYLDKLNYEGIKMQMAVKYIDRLEKMNGLTINVY